MDQIPNNQPCPHCGRYDNRGISIDAVIIKDNKVLLIKRGVEPFKGYWGTPGGYIEWDESAEDAVRREVREETSMDVEDVKFVAVKTDPHRHPKQVIDLIYLVKTSGEPKFGDDTTEAEWFDLDNLPSELAFDHKQNIEDARKII